MEPITPLLPCSTGLQLDSLYMDEPRHRIELQLSSTQPSPACPGCGFASDRVHAHYARSVSDLPWTDWTVELHLSVRKFRCCNPLCPRKIFCERLPSVVQPWARTTNRLRERQCHIGMALGGQAGTRLTRHLHLATSRNTLLRLIRSGPIERQPPPRILGVDDFAKRKGQNYGTILVDLEEGRVIELLADREAQTLSDWLRAHPGVEVICRDRAGAYADGARRGAPSATQIADRFHLVHNLIEVLQQAFERHRTLLTLPSSTSPEVSSPALVTEPDPSSTVSEAVRTHVVPPALTRKGEARMEHYRQAQALDEQGWTRSAIARHLGIRRHTVRRYVEAEAFPDRRHGRGPLGRSKLDPYKAYLVERWNAGCRTGTQLLEEIRQRGYDGGHSIVYDYVTRLRKAQGLPPRSRMFSPGEALREEEAERLTPRQAAFLVMRRAEKLPEADQHRIEHLRKAHPELDEAVALGQSYLRILRERMSAEFDAWLERASTSALVSFRRFARSLRSDYEAVKAALEHSWSSGPVEGHVNRLKMLKRQMYGRAKLDLLQRRLLYAA